MKGRKGRTDVGHRVTLSLKEYCRDKIGSFMVSFLGRKIKLFSNPEKRKKVKKQKN